MALTAVQRILYPVQAAFNLRQQGFLPKLDKGLSIGIDLIGKGAETIAAAEQSIKTTAQTVGLPIYQARPDPRQSTFSTIAGAFAKLASVYFGGWGNAANMAAQAAVKEWGPEAPTAPKLATFTAQGRTNMGLFDDLWGGVQQAAQGIFPTNAGIDWNSLLQQGVGLATTALAPRSSPMSIAPASMAPAMSAAGAVARVGATVGRGFFNRFPNLATAIQGLRNQGQNVTRAKLYGVLKRFGPEFLVTGGLLTAAAVNELAVAGPGYRRMNPANVRALRRSVRRIESFHKLCKTTDSLSGRRRRKC